MKKILSVLLMFILFISPVFADEVTANNAKTDIVENQVINADESINYDKEVDGSGIFAGNLVNFDGKVNGALIAAGNNVDALGEAEYAFVAGNNLNVKATIFKDAFIAGNAIEVNANIKRDILVAASSIKVSGVIERNARLYGSNVTLENVKVLGNVKIEAENLTIGENVEIVGELNYKASEENISKTLVAGNIVSEKLTITKHAVNIFKSRALSYGGMLLVFAVIALLIPNKLKNTGKEDVSFYQVVSYIGYALVFLILVPVAALMLFMLGIGTPLALLTLVSYIAIIYLSYGFAGFYLGKKIGAKLKKDTNPLLEGLIGISILYLVSLIPYVGGIITVIAYLCGIGVILSMFKK